MEELEVQTYKFAVEGIGFVKSLEKEYPEIVPSELKYSMGNVSMKFIDALNSKENENFAENLRGCYENAKKSSELLVKLEGITNNSLLKQNEKLINDIRSIINKLDNIKSKLIY